MSTTESERMFPVMGKTLKAVSWNLVAAHEDGAQRNHQQSLERLAERGGLAPVELLALWRNARLDYVFLKEWRGDRAEAECLRLLPIGQKP